MVFAWAVVVAATAAALYATLRVVFTRSYPIYQPGYVAEAATLFDADPFLILSVMKVESGFDPTATSPRGAVGLMQVMPDTANWIVKEVRPEGLEWVEEGWSEEELYDPRKNILIGSWYLTYLERRFGDVRMALAAYNSGQGRVLTWLQQEQVRAGEDFAVDDIPLRETREFVRRVLAVREWYERLYRGKLDF